MKKPIFVSIFTAFVLTYGATLPAWASGTPKLQNLDSNMVDSVLKDFSAALTFRPVEPASSYGKIWGFSFGVIGGITDSGRTKNTVPGAGDVKWLPSADIFAGVQLPLGIAVEAGFIPSLTISDAKFKRYGGNLKWTLTDVFFKDIIPFDIAVRGGFNTTQFSYNQTISGVSSRVTYDGDIWNLQAGLGKSFFGLLEPYANIGYVHASNTLAATGSVTLFNTSLTVSNSLDRSYSSLWLNGGFQIKLLVLTISAQYDRLFGTDVFTGKLGFKF